MAQFKYRGKMILCREIIRKHRGKLHGWRDAFNPKYNWSYEPKEIKRLLKKEKIKKIKMTEKKH